MRRVHKPAIRAPPATFVFGQAPHKKRTGGTGYEPQSIKSIAVSNRQLGQLRARIKKLKDWIYAQPLQDAPTIGEMMDAINKGQNLNTRWKRLNDLQTCAKVLIFVQRYNISDVAQLADTITKIHQQRYDLANTITATKCRISKLNEHLAQVDIFNQYKGVYKKHQQLDPKKRGAYAEKHAEEIEQYKSALTYLKDHLNGRDKIPERA